MLWATTANLTTGSSLTSVRLWSTGDTLGDDPEAAGSAGVREPRRPLQPLDSSGVALALPHTDAIDAGRVRGAL